jgi:hypothetical protein
MEKEPTEGKRNKVRNKERGKRETGIKIKRK